MNRNSVKDHLSNIVSTHVPKNSKGYKVRFYDAEPSVGMFGQKLDPKPFDGKVIALTEEAIFVKTGRIEFAVLDSTLASLVPVLGDQIAVTPYSRRDFNGDRLDKPREESHVLNGVAYTTKTVILGGETTHLPVPAPTCPYLKDLIDQLENGPAPDRFRSMAHLLVDAAAKDFSVVDPEPSDVINTPPELSFEVATEKYRGRVAILYQRSLDFFEIQLRPEGSPVQRHENIDFSSLGSELESLIDDGQWRRINIVVTKAAPVPRVARSRSA